MHTEFEAKFLNIDIENIRNKLRNINAELIKPMHLMKRVTIDTPEMKKRNAFLRIREGEGKVSVTYKQFDDNSVDGAKEIEINVNDFEETIKLFDALNLRYQSYQESKREIWKLNDVEIVIDLWPWLDPYIEIEASNKEEVINTSKELGLNWDDAVFGSVNSAYQIKYPSFKNHNLSELKNVKFDDDIPEIFN